MLAPAHATRATTTTPTANDKGIQRDCAHTHKREYAMEAWSGVGEWFNVWECNYNYVPDVALCWSYSWQCDSAYEDFSFCYCAHIHI